MVAADCEVTLTVPALAWVPAQPSPDEPPLAVQLVVFGGELQLSVTGDPTEAVVALAVRVLRLPVKVT